MNKQTEIKESTVLLMPDGNLARPGYCKHNLFRYNPEMIKRENTMRLKEWDYYQISDGNIMIQLNFFNISLATCATFGLVNLKTGRKISGMATELFTPHKNRLSKNGDVPNYTEYKRGGTKLIFDVRETERRLYFEGTASGKKVKFDVTCYKLPEHESITIATPFKELGCFFLTQKLNCLATEGTVVAGNEKYTFTKDKTFTVLDWGRGVWPHTNTWYWGNGSTYLDGKLFGFELTWGFGDESNATETAIFYDGKCHKIGAVHLEKDPEDGAGWMNEWHFISEDGRLDLTMKPYYDHYTNLLPLNMFGMKTHQVHGLWSGKVVLDDGTELNIKDMYAFCEKVHNKF